MLPPCQNLSRATERLRGCFSDGFQQYQPLLSVRLWCWGGSVRNSGARPDIWRGEVMLAEIRGGKIMSVLTPEFEFVDGADNSIRYLEHGWPTDLCRWHNHEVLELHLIVETRGKTFVGDYIGEFSPGSLYLIGPNLPHNWVTDEFGNQEPTILRDMMVQFHLNTINLVSAFPDFRELDGLLQRAAGGIEFIDFESQIARHHLAAIRDAKGADRIVKFLAFMLLVNEHPEQKILSVANSDYQHFNTHQSNIARVVDHIINNFAEDISLAQQ